MLRYFAIAAVLVFLTVASVATWWLRQPHRALTIKSVPVTMAPRPEPTGDTIGSGAGVFLADAPWVLSTLPECLAQVSEATGSIAYVRAHVPPEAVEVVPPATLVYNDCRIFVTTRGTIVHRGPDRLRVPPPVRVYRIGTRLFVLHLEGARAQLRGYVPSNM